MNGKGDKHRVKWSKEYEKNHNRIFGDKMAKNELTKKQQKELQKLTNDIIGEAKNVKSDYEKNPSEMSGSVVEIHENSPFMNENYKDNRWKYVIHGDVKDGIEAAKKVKKNKKKP